MKRVTKHIKMLAFHIVQEGMGYPSDTILEIANQEWELETNRPYTTEDYHDACAWIDRRLA
tara:strand:- start:6169 stop:6351 length:183 start_codon:yes stop_codon:yes gene_type:complete